MRVPESILFYKNVLVVDDDNASFILINELLSNPKLHVFWADTFQSAHELICSDTCFSLIILDYRLPGGKYGTELLPLIKQTAPEVPVMFITAVTRNYDFEIEVHLKNYDVMYKPIDVHDFVCIAKGLLSEVMEFS